MDGWSGLLKAVLSPLLAYSRVTDLPWVCRLGIIGYRGVYLKDFLKVKSESYSVMSDSLWPHGLYSPWNSSGQNTGVGSLSLLQQIFPTQESNRGLLHCRQILYQLSYEGSPYKLMDGNICSCNHPWILLIGKNIVYQLLFIILFFLRFSFPFLTLTNILESNSIC